MESQQLKDVSLDECQAIIAEFDANLDGTMDFNEYSNCVLPATNQMLRDYCLYGHKQFEYQSDQAKGVPASLVARILHKEKELCRKKLQAKVDLFDVDKEDMQKLFSDISRGLQYISMPDLIYFLEQQGFFPRNQEVEALLRRCDHDSDGCLSYQEFCELVEDPPSSPPNNKKEIPLFKEASPS